MAIYGERTRRELGRDGKGVHGTIVYLCDWPDIDGQTNFAGLPQVGDAWVDAFGITFPALRCVSGVGHELDGNLGEYVAEFSTEGRRPDNEAYCEWNLDISMEAGPDLQGYTWQSISGLPVADPPPHQLPVGILTGKMRRELPPYQVVFGAMGKVNSVEFQGYPKGCVLFLGASADNSIGIDGSLMSAACIYKFSVKRSPDASGTDAHNFFWRPPVHARDRQGNLLYWHNDPLEPLFYLTGKTPTGEPPDLSVLALPLDAEKYPNYTDQQRQDLIFVVDRDNPKLASPVWANQVPRENVDEEDHTSAPEGVGGWDFILDTGEAPFYEECDFAAELDIPEPS